MSQILSRLAVSNGWFRPKTPRQFFALQLCRRLDDIDNLQQYQLMVEQYPQDLILQAYRRALHHQNAGSKLAERFSKTISRLAGQEENEQSKFDSN